MVSNVCCCCLVTESCLILCDPVDCSPPNFNPVLYLGVCVWFQSSTSSCVCVCVCVCGFIVVLHPGVCVCVRFQCSGCVCVWDFNPVLRVCVCVCVCEWDFNPVLHPGVCVCVLVNQALLWDVFCSITLYTNNISQIYLKFSSSHIKKGNMKQMKFI